MDSIEQLEGYQEAHDGEGVGFFTNPDYLSAIIGMSQDGRLVYDYDKMVEYLMEKEKWSEEDAMDFIDCNAIPTIPYMGEKHPVVVYGIE